MHGVPGDQHTQFGHDLGMPAHPQVGVDPPLQRGHPVLLQAQHLQLENGADADVDEGGALPHPQRPAEQFGGGAVVARLVGGASGGGDTGELVGVDLAGLHLQEVSPVLGDQDVLGPAGRVAVERGGDLAAQLEDVRLQGGDRAARDVLPPYLLHEGRHGHHPVGLQGEQRQDLPGLGRGGDDGHPVLTGRQWSQDLDLHVHALLRCVRQVPGWALHGLRSLRRASHLRRSSPSERVTWTGVKMSCPAGDVGTVPSGTAPTRILAIGK